jgi:transcriptional regulator with XRE-family HTH domain
MADLTWSEALQNYIQKNGLTKVAAARALGVWPSQVLDWCRGGRPRDAAVLIAVQRWSEGVVRADLPTKADAVDEGAGKAAAR